MSYKKLLILGLDAMPWPILNSMISLGVMPRLQALIEGGSSGKLRSTIPHQTPAAWCTFMTGVQPWLHGIVNWYRYDPVGHTIDVAYPSAYRGRTIYDIFSRTGLKVGAFMQPVLFPPFPVNGFTVTGFDGAGINAPFANPRSLEKEILEINPKHSLSFGLDEVWDGRHTSDDGAFENNLMHIRERVKNVGQLCLELYNRMPADVLMAYFQEPDFILHRAWRWCDPKTGSDNPRRRELAMNVFRELDQACGALLDATAHENRLVLVLSDHGQRPDATRVRMNSVLEELGFIVRAGSFGMIREGTRRIMKKLSGKVPRKPEARGVGYPVDWSRTKAFMPFQSCTGFIYVNLEGRQSRGSVPPEQREKVRNEVIEKLRAYRDPTSGVRYFEEVGAFDNSRDLNLPDIYVQPMPGVEFVRRAKHGQISYPTKRSFAGLHDPDGIYVLNGPGVRTGKDRHAHIIDMAPTLLAAMQRPVPTYMQGRVLNESFVTPLRVIPDEAIWDVSPSATESQTPEEVAAIEKRLKEMGYLD